MREKRDAIRKQNRAIKQINKKAKEKKTSIPSHAYLILFGLSCVIFRLIISKGI